MGARLLPLQPTLDESHPSVTFGIARGAAGIVDFEFHDLEDGSLAALSADPQRVVAAGEHAATSFFERMQHDHPAEELTAGLKRLRADTVATPDRAGTGTVLSWTKP